MRFWSFEERERGFVLFVVCISYRYRRLKRVNQSFWTNPIPMSFIAHSLLKLSLLFFFFFLKKNCSILSSSFFFFFFLGKSIHSYNTIFQTS
jgi:hypothetical protein